jgi:hypothetical protein
MSDASEKRKGPSPEDLDKRFAFERLYRDWHTALAAKYDPDAPEDQRTTNDRSERYEAAEAALMTAPAPLPYAVFYKWELLDYLMTDAAESGRCTNNRELVALASIKADVIRFGLKGSG